MKVLLFSDLHLDTAFFGVGPDVARARRAARRTTLRRITALARSERVDALLCGGDLYEQDRFSPDTAAFLRDVFEDVAVPVHVAPGDHDRYGPRSLYRQVAWSSNVHVFTEDRLVPVELGAGVTLWGAAHRAPATPAGFLDGFEVDRGGVNLALFHGSEVSGMAEQEPGTVPHAPFTAAQVEASGLDHAFLGHFPVPCDAERHTYPGNPDPLERGSGGAVLCTVHDDGRVDRVRHDVSTSRVHDVAVDPAEVADADEVPYDLAALAEEPTVRGRFVRDVRSDTDLDDDTRRRVLVTGLRALDGRTADLAVP